MVAVVPPTRPLVSIKCCLAHISIFVLVDSVEVEGFSVDVELCGDVDCPQTHRHTIVV